jgi:hypothetical protein
VSIGVTSTYPDTWKNDSVTETSPQTKTFFDEIGGMPTIERIVARFYAGVATDDVAAPRRTRRSGGIPGSACVMRPSR